MTLCTLLRYKFFSNGDWLPNSDVYRRKKIEQPEPQLIDEADEIAAETIPTANTELDHHTEELNKKISDFLAHAVELGNIKRQLDTATDELRAELLRQQAAVREQRLAIARAIIQMEEEELAAVLLLLQ